MKKILVNIIPILFNLGVIQAEKSHLEYSIPEDADKYGPMTTREMGVTYVKYFIKDRDTSDNLALLGVEYFENEVLFKRELYKEGELHGVQKKWHKNRQLEVEAPYEKGKMHGVFQHWNSKGELIGKYEMDEGNGTRLIFQNNGHINIRESFSNNFRNGWYVKMHENGIVEVLNKASKGEFVSRSSAAFYDSGDLYLMAVTNDQGTIKNGLLTYFSQDGKFMDIVYYINGGRVKREEYAKESNGDEDLPSILNDPKECKKLLSSDVRSLIEEYKLVELVKIPLEFDDEEKIVTKSGNPLVLPK